jgi:hypothetical protein
MLPYTAIDLIIAMNARESAHLDLRERRERDAGWCPDARPDRPSVVSATGAVLRRALHGARSLRPARSRPASGDA